MRQGARAKHRISLFATLLLASCGTSELEPQRGPTDDPAALEFEAIIDPAAGTFQLTGFGRSFAGLDPAVVVQDGTPGAGPANTVELVTANIATDVDGTGACGFASSFCADVTIRSFYAGALGDVYAEITAITPAAGHTALNSASPAMGLSNTFGLWSYGAIAGGGGSAMQRWVFGDDGTAYRISGRVMANLCTDGVQDADETGVDCGGASCASCSSCSDGIQNGGETGVDCGGSCPNACVTIDFALLGSQEVPATDSPSRGACTAELSGTQASLEVSCTHDVVSPTGAAIHNGAAGSNGASVFDLGAGASPISATIPITAAQAADFLAGNYYLNMTSAGRAAGDIRGQMSAHVASFLLVPRQETPPVSSGGNGACNVHLSPGGAALRVLCTHNLTGGQSPNAANIRRGAPGVSGPIVFNLGTGATPINQLVTLAAGDLADYLAGDLYVNVQSTMFPNGEMRGQIAQLVESRGAGEQEVPPAGSSATVNCRSFLNPSSTSLVLSCTHNVVGPTNAHVHTGAPGVNGGVTFDLGTGASPINATLALSAAQAATFSAGDFYVNVHSAAFPGGEARAQLSTNWSFPLDGRQHIPERMTPHTGHCLAHMNPAGTTLRFECTHDIPSNDVTVAHMHRCNGNCSGVIWTPNFPTFTSPFAATVVLSPTDVVDAIAGNFYIHLHSMTFAGAGELRGQVTDIYDFALEGAQVVPPSGSAATGSCFGFLGYGESASFALRCTHTVAAPGACHLHRGAVGVNGPTLQTVSAVATSPINFITQLSSIAAGFMRGGETYVDLHSAALPGGELRGQVVP